MGKTRKTGILGIGVAVEADGDAPKEVTGLQAIIEKQRQRKEKVRRIIDGAKDIKTEIKRFGEWCGEDMMLKRTAPLWAPWAVSGAVLAIAAANTIHANMTGTNNLGAATVGGAAFALALAVAAYRSRKAFIRRFAPRNPAQARWILACSGAALVWLFAATLLGMDIDGNGPALALSLMATTVVLARSHWRRHRIPDPTAPPVPELTGGWTPELEEAVDAYTSAADHPGTGDQMDPDVAKYIKRWEQTVTQKGPIRDSSIAFLDYIPGVDDDGNHINVGKRYLVRLPEYGVTFSGAVATLPQLEMALHRPMADMAMERYEPADEDEDPDPTLVTLDIIDNSPVRKPVPFKGPRYVAERDSKGRVVNGYVRVGPYANGDGQATWRTYSGGDSMWSGFVVGGTGSGKSGIIDGIAFSLAAPPEGDDRPHTALWYMDGQRGASSPFLPHVADWAALDEASWDDMLLALHKICDARSKENAARMATRAADGAEGEDERGFNPTPDRPGLLVIIDECQQILHPGNVKTVEEIARIGRKVGISLLLASQTANYESLGRSGTLRALLMDGNVLVLRTKGSTENGFIPGLEMDPASLPSLPGYGYTVASTTGVGRTAPFRGAFCPDYLRLWRALGYTPATLDPVAQGAANLATDWRYMRRHEIRAEQASDNIAYIEALKAAATERVDLGQSAPAPEPVSAPPGGGIDFDPLDGAGDDLDKASEDLYKVFEDLDAELGQVGRDQSDPGLLKASTPVPVEQTMAELSDLDRAVLDAVIVETGTVKGHAPTAQVVSMVQSKDGFADVYRQRVSEALCRLLDAGLVYQAAGRGKYAAADAVVAHVSEQRDNAGV